LSSIITHHHAGPAMTATSSGARIGDTYTAAPRDGVTTIRWPGLPGRLPRWRTLADIDGGRSAARRTPVNPRCGENTSRLDTASSSIGQSSSAGQIRNGTGHAAARSEATKADGVVRGAVAVSGRRTAERESVLARVAAVEQLCAQYRIPIAAVSLQCALAHPAVASVLLGASTLSEQARNFDAARTNIPDELRVTLRKSGHQGDDAPTLPATREARA
jgi:hypothetical protein